MLTSYFQSLVLSIRLLCLGCFLYGTDTEVMRCLFFYVFATSDSPLPTVFLSRLLWWSWQHTRAAWAVSCRLATNWWPRGLCRTRRSLRSRNRWPCWTRGGRPSGWRAWRGSRGEWNSRDENPTLWPHCTVKLRARLWVLWKRPGQSRPCNGLTPFYGSCPWNVHDFCVLQDIGESWNVGGGGEKGECILRGWYNSFIFVMVIKYRGEKGLILPTIPGYTLIIFGTSQG